MISRVGGGVGAKFVPWNRSETICSYESSDRNEFGFGVFSPRRAESARDWFRKVKNLAETSWVRCCAPGARLTKEPFLRIQSRRRPGSCARAPVDARKRSSTRRTGHRRRVKRGLSRGSRILRSGPPRAQGTFPVRSATFPSGVAPIPGSVEGAEMSEQVGERKGSGPFKEGTIKNACYEVLKNAGSRGLTVRTRARASFIPSRTPPSSPPIVRLFEEARNHRRPGVERFPPLRTRAAGVRHRPKNPQRRSGEARRCHPGEYHRRPALERYARRPPLSATPLDP